MRRAVALREGGGGSCVIGAGREGGGVGGQLPGGGSGGEGFVPVSIITVCERRDARGLDAHVPLILRGDALYDPDLDRFFVDLPLAVLRSRHSLRAYAYDVAGRSEEHTSEPPSLITTS